MATFLLHGEKNLILAGKVVNSMSYNYAKPLKNVIG